MKFLIGMWIILLAFAIIFIVDKDLSLKEKVLTVCVSMLVITLLRVGGWIMFN